MVVVGLVAVAPAVQAWGAWPRNEVRPALAAGAPGRLVSVLLVNAQVYYGERVELSPAFLRLVNVYCVQAVATQAANQPGNQFVNRSRADWHGPQWMSIPTERIVFIKGVGPKSRLAELMAQEKKLGVAQ